MVLDVFKHLSSVIDFKSILGKPDNFYKIDDNFLWRLDHPYVKKLKKEYFINI